MKLFWTLVYTWMFMITIALAGVTVFGIVAGFVYLAWWISVLSFLIGPPLTVYAGSLMLQACDRAVSLR